LHAAAAAGAVDAAAAKAHAVLATPRVRAKLDAVLATLHAVFRVFTRAGKISRL
jgi:hypothetical protein